MKFAPLYTALRDFPIEQRRAVSKFAAGYNGKRGTIMDMKRK